MIELPILNTTYDVFKLVADIIGHTDKRWRYSIGTQLEREVLELLQQLIMAKNAPKQLKGAYLIRADAHCEVAIIELRLMLELTNANETKLFQAQSHLREIGRMIGGWLKSLGSV